MHLTYEPCHILINGTVTAAYKVIDKHDDKLPAIWIAPQSSGTCAVYNRPSYSLPPRLVATNVTHGDIPSVFIMLQLGLRDRALLRPEAFEAAIEALLAAGFAFVQPNTVPEFNYRDDQGEVVMYHFTGDPSIEPKYIKLDYSLDGVLILSTLHPSGVWMPRTDVLNSDAYLKTLIGQVLAEI